MAGIRTLRERRNVFKCELCGRKLLTEKALKSHKQTVHSRALREKALLTVKKPITKAKKVIPKLLKAPREFKKPVKMERKSLTKYSCLRCKRYFKDSSFLKKHMQKCGVSPELKITNCEVCSQPVGEGQHVCLGALKFVPVKETFVCLGCHLNFDDVDSFHAHIVYRKGHEDNIETMYFRDMDEYMQWKLDMEKKTNTKFNWVVEKKKQTVYCSYKDEQKVGNLITKHRCPARLIIEKYSTGILVHHYKEHFGHENEPYVLVKPFKKFSVTRLLHQGSFPNITDTDDLYIQFKMLMESLVLNSAKTNVDTLQVLYSCALEMMIALTCSLEDYDDVERDSGALKPLDDQQIFKALSNITKAETTPKKLEAPEVSKSNTPIILNQLKRKRPIDDSPSVNNHTPKILSCYTLREKNLESEDEVKDDVTQNSKMSKENVNSNSSAIKNVKSNTKVAVPIAKRTRSTLVSDSPSFNDTYKDFVESNFNVNVEPDKKDIIKTKVGQCKRNVSLSPDDPKKSKLYKTPQTETEEVNSKVVRPKFSRTYNGPGANKSNKSLKFESPTPTARETPKLDIKVGTKKTARKSTTPRNLPRKETDIIKHEHNIVDSRSSPELDAFDVSDDDDILSDISGVKIEKYEVMEQEDDCNILILKL